MNRALKALARSLAGVKGYVTNPDPKLANSDFVIGSYHRLFQIEKFFRMSKPTDKRGITDLPPQTRVHRIRRQRLFGTSSVRTSTSAEPG